MSQSLPRCTTLPATVTNSNNDRDKDEDEIGSDDDDEEEEEVGIVQGLEYYLDNDEDLNLLSRESLLHMTVPQLKQQCRLRGKNVTGNKSQLIERLLERERKTIDTANLRRNKDDETVDCRFVPL